MDPAKQKQEYEILVNRARRAGILKAHYPAEGLTVIQIPAAPRATAEDPPVGSPPAATPPPPATAL